jgi:hypothetical protein
MIFFGKSELKKAELQIDSLQKKVADLGAELLNTHADAARAKAEAAQALAGAQTHLDSRSHELVSKSAELELALATAAKIRQDGEFALQAAKVQIAALNQTGSKAQEAIKLAQAETAKVKLEAEAAIKSSAESKAHQAVAAKELDAKLKELIAIKAEREKLAKLAQQAEAKHHDDFQENELLLLQLLQAQQELVEYDEQKSELEKAFQAYKVSSEAEAKAKQTFAIKDLEVKSKELAAKASELTGAQAAVNTAKAEAAIAKQDAEVAIKSLDEAKAQQTAIAKELANKSKELEAINKELIAPKAEHNKLAKLAQQTEAKYQDSAQENELLLLQLMQAQEELVDFYEQKDQFEKLYLVYKARWERLEKRLPTYLDFGAIDIAGVDGLSDVPSITWHVKDFAQSGVALSQFSFVTVLKEGTPGIGLIKGGQPQAIVPKLLGADKDQLSIFLRLGTTEFKQLAAAVSILEQLEAGQWAGFEFPAQFDLSFWRPSIQILLAQFKLLPAMLRFDEVRLKRELINPDYEHLWLEFHGLSYGAVYWKKFEIRLGASLVQADGFSHYPKFEIPLIDGKTKPFDSWYAESQDDSGAKLELRFALNKNMFDVAVWSKLTNADKALVLRVIYAMPEALKRLEKQKTAIYRPWATWIDFATAAVNVIEVNKAAAKLAASESAPDETKALPAPTEDSIAGSAAQGKLPVPAKRTSTGAKAGKVISINTKPVAQTVARPTAKPAAKKSPAVKANKGLPMDDVSSSSTKRGASSKR